MTWRDEQSAATRQAILDTFRDLSSRAGATPVTVAGVARASGISPATIYRHFPNRDRLVDAAATQHMYLGGDVMKGAWEAEDMRAHLEALWSSFDGHLNVVREGAVSEAGREMRRVRFRAQMEAMSTALRAAERDPEEPGARRFCSVVGLLTSVHAFLDLHDRQGLDVSEAVDAVVWALEVLAAHEGLEGQALWQETSTTGGPPHDHHP